MSTLVHAIGTLSLVAFATTLGAQGPGGFGGSGGGPIGATADFLLAHTGDLALTDAQVVRLAAISRRSNARRTTMMARMDSARGAARPAPGDSAGGPGRGRRFSPPPQADMQQMRDQMHADIRDAIAVLTPDQQASAWMMVAARPALGGRPGGAMGPRLGRGPDGDRARPAERGPISRPPAPRDVPRRPEGAANSQP